MPSVNKENSEDKLKNPKKMKNLSSKMKKSKNKIKNSEKKHLSQILEQQLNDTTTPEGKHSPPEESEVMEQQLNKPKIPERRHLPPEEFKLMKQKLREKSNLVKNFPKFSLRDKGVEAEIDIPFDYRKPLFVSDLQHLLMYSQVGPISPYSPAKWCSLDRYNRLKSTVFLVIENMTLDDYVNNENELTSLKSLFEVKVEVVSSSSYKSDIVSDLCMVPITGMQMSKYKEKYGSIQKAHRQSVDVFLVKYSQSLGLQIDKPVKTKSEPSEALPPSDVFSRTKILLSGWQLVDENFPLPITGLRETKFKDYVCTKDSYKPVTAFSPMFGLDCEMCLTSIMDNELTSLSVVDENHRVVYHTLVKPRNKIVNYLTRFSGITHKMMLPVTKRIEDVQNDLRKLLPADAILVGHSLGGDLHALKMMHPYVIDSSVIFNKTGDRTRKTKLKILSEEYLNESIQQGTQGHCPAEDSLASLKLVQLKLSKSITFGDAASGGYDNQSSRGYSDMATTKYATSVLKNATKTGQKALVVAGDGIADHYDFCINKSVDVRDENIKCERQESNDDIIKTICNESKDFSLTIGHVKLTDGDIQSSATGVWKEVDQWVRDIYEAMEKPGLLCVLLGGNKTNNGCCFLKLKQPTVL